MFTRIITVLVASWAMSSLGGCNAAVTPALTSVPEFPVTALAAVQDADPTCCCCTVVCCGACGDCPEGVSCLVECDDDGESCSVTCDANGIPSSGAGCESNGG